MEILHASQIAADQLVAAPMRVSDLLGEAERAQRAARGLRRADMLVPPGQYRRRRPHLIEAAHLEPPHVAEHAAYMDATQQRHEAVHCLTLAGATVAGQGTVVTAGAVLIRESAAEFLAEGGAPDGFAPVWDGRFVLTTPVARHVDRPSLLVKRPWYRNYGHWLVDGAALLALLSRARLPPNVQLVLGPQATEAMRRVVADTLAAVAPELPVVLQPDDEAWTFSHLLYVTPVHVPPLIKLPESLACLRALLLRTQLITRPPGRRVFVTRGSGAARRLDNEEELRTIAAAHNFEAVELEPLPLLEKARLFHEADIIVGVKGAGLANLLFCRPNTAVIVLSPGDFPDPFFWDLAAQQQGRYLEVFGPLTARDQPQSRNPFVIEPEQFEKALEAVL